MNLLSQDLTKVDTSFPVMEKCAMRFIISEMKVEKTKDGTKDMLITILKSKYEAKSDSGDVLKPGFPITERLVLTPSEKKTEEKILQDVARFRAAITGDHSGTFMPLEQYLNKEVDCMVEIEEDASGQYGKQNRLRKMKPAGK